MKKAIVLLLVFLLFGFSGNLYAEKKGATLVIIKKDGLPVRGELIAVKENSLVLLDPDSDADVSVDAENIKFIMIVKKSKILLGIALGLLLGGGLGSLYGTSTDTYDSDLRPVAFIAYGGGGAALGGLVGGFIGASAGKDEIIQIEGKSGSEINKALEQLRKKARVPDFR